MRVLIHDIDPGAAGVTPAWVTAQVQRTGALSAAAAAHVRNIVAGYADDEDGQVPDA